MAATHPRQHATRPVTEQPGNSARYSYERLTEKRFQQLCAALLANRYPGVRCYPVGMSDGGRDMTRQVGDEVFVYQVKWANHAQQNPAQWLDAAVRGEEANIERLVREDGATKYFLMTSVAGTSGPGVGQIDQLDIMLAEHSKRLGIHMDVLWQVDIDALVDAAPDAIKWTYADMLVGWDVIRYLIFGSGTEGRAALMRETFKQVMATQWDEDTRVKFKQADMDHAYISDLFVDVEEEIEAQPLQASYAPLSADLTAPRGALDYLLRSAQPFVVVHGVPGQGKSTLGQYVCQVHRASLYAANDTTPEGAPSQRAESPKVPLRVDLKDYASWSTGNDPFRADFDGKLGKPRMRRNRSLESFLADFCSAKSGGRNVSVEDVQDALGRYPVLIVLDGLDEVADPRTRGAVVKAIDEFASRLKSGGLARLFQLVVTSRPNSSNLPEPNREIFQTIRLRPLSRNLQRGYLTKWAKARQISPRDRRELSRVFDLKTGKGHVAALADNPMQLTILLFLIGRRGNSVPDSLADLYGSYMEVLLDREADKTPMVNEHRPEIEEVTSHLAWHMQSKVELDAAAGSMTKNAIVTELFAYLQSIDGSVDLAQDLFSAVTDRFWALSSKIAGRFEFVVQPVREYFAARFLNEYASRDGEPPPKDKVLGELIQRPYWLNTARFFASAANRNERSALADGIEEVLKAGRHPLQERVAIWTLMTDGVFREVSRPQRRVAELLADDLSVRLVLSSSHRDGSFPPMPPSHGGKDLAAALRADIEARPAHSLSLERTRMLHLVGVTDAEFDEWWTPRMLQSIGAPDETTWLGIGAPFKAGMRLPRVDTRRLSLATRRAAQATLEAGVSLEPGDPGFEQLKHAVLAGFVSDADVAGSGFAQDLLRTLRPQHFLRLARPDETDLFNTHVSHPADDRVERNKRSQSFRHLTATEPKLAPLQRAGTFGMGGKGTTAPWQNTAHQLAEVFESCWLAADIALIGAATSDTRNGGDSNRSRPPLGPDAHFGQLVEDLRTHSSETRWWKETFTNFPDELSRLIWAVGLVTGADRDVVLDNFPELDEATRTADDDAFLAAAYTSSRIGASGVSRRLQDVRTSTSQLGRRAQLLLTHHGGLLPATDVDTLKALARYGAASWPVAAYLSGRAAAVDDEAALAVLRALPVDAQADPTDPDWGLGADAREKVLSSPGDYPWRWVVRAEVQHSTANQDPPLTRVAREQGWLQDL